MLTQLLHRVIYLEGWRFYICTCGFALIFLSIGWHFLFGVCIYIVSIYAVESAIEPARKAAHDKRHEDGDEALSYAHSSKYVAGTLLVYLFIGIPAVTIVVSTFLWVIE